MRIVPRAALGLLACLLASAVAAVRAMGRSSSSPSNMSRSDQVSLARASSAGCALPRGTATGGAGATKAIVVQLASLTDVHWSMSGEVVLMTLLGGMGTIFGPVVGAFVIIAMQSYLAELGSWVTFVQGIIFVVCVLAFRRGIMGELEAFLRHRRK